MYLGSKLALQGSRRLCGRICLPLQALQVVLHLAQLCFCALHVLPQVPPLLVRQLVLQLRRLSTEITCL